MDRETRFMEARADIAGCTLRPGTLDDLRSLGGLPDQDDSSPPAHQTKIVHLSGEDGARSRQLITTSEDAQLRLPDRPGRQDDECDSRLIDIPLQP